MVYYTCGKCNYSTYHKSVYDKHLKRKNPCEKSPAKIPLNHAEIPLNHTEIPLNHTEIPPNHTEIPPNHTKKETEKVTCNYCYLHFTRKDSLTRHLKHNCKVKKQDDTNKEQVYQHLLNEHLNIKNENETIKKELIEIRQKLSINKTTNNINNGTINNIQIVAHGKEDLSQIKEDVVLQLVKRGWRSIPMFTKYLHCNDKFPEQKNIYINDINRKYCMVYNGNDWLLKDKTETINELYQTKYDFLEENFNIYYDQLEEYQQRSFKNFVKLHKEDEPFVRKIKEELKTLLYNNRNKILNNK
jgi:hypothetical protein